MTKPSKELKDLIDLSAEELSQQHFDYLAVGIIDFNRKKIQSFELSKKNLSFESEVSSPYLFDLASLTKPLFLNLLYLTFPQKFSDEMMLLLEHRGGLPAWARLSKSNWREKVCSFEIKKSATEYSDLSALRLMLELEAQLGESLLLESCKKIWHPGLQFWIELENFWQCPPTGMRQREEIRGVVHDDNAYNIGGVCSHAGLFSDVESLGKTLINIDEKFNLVDLMSKKIKGEQRFILGWDRVLDQEKSLAGRGCSNKTFGHLGFSGTSIWIDCETKMGQIILTNGTQNYWYDRAGLNNLRKKIGSFIWESHWD